MKKIWYELRRQAGMANQANVWHGALWRGMAGLATQGKKRQGAIRGVLPRFLAIKQE